MDFAPLIRAARASLIDGLEQRIEAWNDDTANSVELDHVAEEDIHFGPMPGWAGWKLPALEVCIPDATLDEFAIEQLRYRVRGPFYITAWVEGVAADSAVLYEKAMGYSAAILDVMMQPDAFGPSIVIESVETSWPGFGVEPDQRQPVGFRVLALHVFRFEDEGARSQ